MKIKVRAKEYWRRLSREKSERKEEKREIYNSRYRCNRALDEVSGRLSSGCEESEAQCTDYDKLAPAGTKV